MEKFFDNYSENFWKKHFEKEAVFIAQKIRSLQ